MNRDWLAVEHYRLHVVETWAEGPRRDATLRAIRSAIESLARAAKADRADFECCVCGAAMPQPA